MSTYQLGFTSEQVEEALSGAHFALNDSWGFTGDQKIIGDSYADIMHMESGAVGQQFLVTGAQTGYGPLSNYSFADFNDVSVTGDSYFESITGETVKQGDFVLTGDFNIDGNIIQPYVQKSISYSVAAGDVTVEATTASTVMTLPTAVGITAQKFEIANSAGGAITVDTTLSQTIYTTGGAVTSVILNDGEVLVVRSNGSNYRSI